MKKIISSILILALTVCTLSGCGGEKMEVPEYPLSQETIEAALEGQELDWKVVSEESWTENHKAYTLNDAEGRKIAVVSSASDGEARFLEVDFMSYIYNESGESISLQTADWVKAIAFATVLYGGLSDQYESYKQFTTAKGDTDVDYEKVKDAAGTLMYEETVHWNGEYDNDITCYFMLGQQLHRPNEDGTLNLDKPDQDLLVVRYSNSDVLEEKMAELEK